jgi:hypothetical protein
MSDIIIITAASAGTWIKERFTPSGLKRMLGEGFLSSYKQKMHDLRIIDDKIYIWAKELQKLLKAAKKANEAGRISDLISVLDGIKSKLNNISSQKTEAENLIKFDDVIHQFEKDPVKSKGLTKEELSILNKEAGLIDDWKRNYLKTKLENKERKERQNAINKLLVNTENIINNVFNYVALLGKARVGGNIGDYYDTLSDISKEQTKFEAMYNDVYTKYKLHELKDEAKEEQKQQEAPAELIVKTQPTPVPPVLPEVPELDKPEINVSLEPAEEEVVEDKPKELKIEVPDLIENKTEVKTDKPKVKKPRATPKKASLEEIMVKKGHADFLYDLVKAAKYNDVELLNKMVLKYSELIDESDTEASIKLLEILK